MTFSHLDQGTAAHGLSANDPFGELSALLWREREVLEEVLFQLTVQQRVLESGDVRWITRVDAGVNASLETMRLHEIIRASEVERLVREHGLPSDSSLRDLARTAPEPWPSVLLDHREALLTIAAEIDGMTTEVRRLLVAGEKATDEALRRLTGQTEAPTTTAPAFGRPTAQRRNVHILDEQA